MRAWLGLLSVLLAILAQNPSGANRGYRSRSARSPHEEKQLFGGIGFLLNGNLLVGVRQDSLLVRLGEDQGEAALGQAHVRPFTLSGRTMQGWLLVAAEGVASDAQLQDWIERATRFVCTLPAK